MTTQTFRARSPTYYDTHIKVDNLLQYLDRSYFSKQQ